jgi:hypothetical protein
MNVWLPGCSQELHNAFSGHTLTYDTRLVNS